MAEYFRDVYEWLVEGYHNLGELMVVNFLWFVFTLLIVTAPPAAAGLYFTTNRLAKEKSAGWRTFFEGFREHLWMSYRWFLANAVVIALLVISFIFYGNVQTWWGGLLQGITLMMGVLWLLALIYTFPLLLEQSDRRLVVALRNSMVLYASRPLYSLGTTALILLLSYLSARYLIPLWAFLTASVCAYLANRAVVHIIRTLPSADSEA